MISPNTFNSGMKLKFSTFRALNSNSFNILQTKTSEDYYISHYDRGNIRIPSLKDGTYYVKIDDYDTVKVNKDEIINLSNNSSIMVDKPNDFIMYVIHLLSINFESSKILTSIWSDSKLEELFNKFVNDCDYVISTVHPENIASNKSVSFTNTKVVKTTKLEEYLRNIYLLKI